MCDVAPGFRDDGLGAIVNNSRGIIFAHQRPEYCDRFGEHAVLARGRRGGDASDDRRVASGDSGGGAVTCARDKERGRFMLRRWRGAMG